MGVYMKILVKPKLEKEYLKNLLNHGNDMVYSYECGCAIPVECTWFNPSCMSVCPKLYYSGKG
jgi:hypothetical protein